MANTQTSNVAHVDSTGDSGFGTSKGDLYLTGIIFTPDAANDEIKLANSATGNPQFYARGATAKSTMYFDMSLTPIRFNGAIHVVTLTSNAQAVLIVRKGQR